jgi:hypothetical protein
MDPDLRRDDRGGLFLGKQISKNDWAIKNPHQLLQRVGALIKTLFSSG